MINMCGVTNMSETDGIKEEIVVLMGRPRKDEPSARVRHMRANWRRASRKYYLKVKALRVKLNDEKSTVKEVS